VRTILVVGIIMSAINISTLAIWIIRGFWIPFAVGMPFVIVLGTLIALMYRKKTY